MSHATLSAWLLRTCERYGPGRLPGAERTDIGAGYAAATGAGLLGSLYSGALALLWLLGSRWLFGMPLDAVLRLSAVATALVVPVAFVTGAVLWRPLVVERGVSAAAAGVVVALCTYAVGTALAAVLAVPLALVLGVATVATAVEPLFLVAIASVYGFGSTVWLAVPLAALSAVAHARARAWQL